MNCARNLATCGGIAALLAACGSPSAARGPDAGPDGGTGGRTGGSGGSTRGGEGGEVAGGAGGVGSGGVGGRTGHGGDTGIPSVVRALVVVQEPAVCGPEEVEDLAPS